VLSSIGLAGGFGPTWTGPELQAPNKISASIAGANRGARLSGGRGLISAISQDPNDARNSTATARLEQTANRAIGFALGDSALAVAGGAG